MCCSCPSEYPGQPADPECGVHGHASHRQAPERPHECNVAALGRHNPPGLGWRCPACGTGWTFKARTPACRGQAFGYWLCDAPGED
jgi:hypothetical protein